VMAPSERAKRMRGAAEGGSAEAMMRLGWWHRKGLEGLEQDDVKATEWIRKAADLGLVIAERDIAMGYYGGKGVEQSFALAAEWGRKSADQGDADAQFILGSAYGLGEGVKKDLPLGQRYLELSAAQGINAAVALLKELRKCVACGELDVHHMICSRCRNRRYCDGICQLRHWESATDPHKLHCVKRRQSAAAGGGARILAPTMLPGAR
jgi:TPR repeat protein